MAPRSTYRSISVAAVALSALMAGCVAESYENCPPEETKRFEVGIRDLVTGQDITATADVSDVVLMLFDSLGGYVTRIDVDAHNIGRELDFPPALNERTPGERLTVSAWGNLETNMTFSEEVGTGHTLDQQFLALKANTEYRDNWHSPGNMFFGLDTLTVGAEGVQRVELTQKTARMAVSVRGLPAGTSADDYYFSMCEQNDGFTFDGTPLRTYEWCKIRENGVFTSSGDFTTAEPYYVIPSVDPYDVSACNAGVCLYKVGGGLETRGSDAGTTDAGCHPQGRGVTRALTSDQAGYVTEDGDLNITGKAVVDLDGNHLALHQGQTTNVLITFALSGEIEIRVRMTAWDELYQWSNW